MRLEQPRARRRLRSRGLLTEPEAEVSLLESLEFIRPGDLELLQKIAEFEFGSERDTLAALALPEILFHGQPTTAEFIERRTEFMHKAKRDFEGWVREPPGRFENEQAVRDLMKSAKELFTFRSLVGPVATPSDATWNVLVEKITASAAKEFASPPDWLEALVCIDPERFHLLSSEDMQRACLRQIAKERREYPVSKDKRQMRLLGVMSYTRILFPNLTEACTLSDEERAVTRAYLAKQRERVTTEEASDFAYYLYILSLVEAPGMLVDKKGLHLSGKKKLGQARPAVPERTLI